MSDNIDLKEYKQYVSKSLKKLSPILQKYALGDFSSPIPVPEVEDEFTELYVGLNLMAEDIREIMDEKLEHITNERKLNKKLHISERDLKLRNKITNIFITIGDDEMYNDVLKLVLAATKSEHGVFGYLDENGAFVVPSMTRHIWKECEVPEKTIVFPRDSWGKSTWPEAIRQKRYIYSNKPSTNIPKGHIPYFIKENQSVSSK